VNDYQIMKTWQGWEILTKKGETCIARTKDGAIGLVELHRRGVLTILPKPKDEQNTAR
jgi:hypothetical protein